MRQSSIAKGRRSGFTVVELLVALGVVLALLLITVMAAGKLRSRSQGAACLANIRQLHMLLVSYANDHQGYFPIAKEFNAEDETSISWIDRLNEASLLIEVERPTTVRGHIILCPGSTVLNSTGKFYVPNNGHYGLNRGLVGYSERNRSESPLTLQAISSPAKTILLSDAGYMMMNRDMVNGGSGVSYIPGIPENKNISAPAVEDARVERHAGYNNVVMVDGHAEQWNSKKYKETWETREITWNGK